MKALSVALVILSGFLFSIGLGVGGMTEAANILGFLDIFGHWKPALVFVMIGAILVYSSFYHVVLKNKKPLFAKSFHLPTKLKLDPSLIIGSAVFGIGWGTAGLCPGPAIVTLTELTYGSLLFCGAMLLGMYIGKGPLGQKIGGQGKSC